MKNKPMLKFSKWFIWEDRKKFPNKTFPGVYMISITNRDLKRREPEYGDVVYIGETKSLKGLSGRWSQLNQAINGKGGHSGGNTIHSHLGNFNTWTKKLFVCGMAVKCNVKKDTRTPNDLIIMGWIAFLEYEAMSNYKNKINREPKYNTK